MDVLGEDVELDIGSFGDRRLKKAGRCYMIGCSRSRPFVCGN